MLSCAEPEAATNTFPVWVIPERLSALALQVCWPFRGAVGISNSRSSVSPLVEKAAKRSETNKQTTPCRLVKFSGDLTNLQSLSYNSSAIDLKVLVAQRRAQQPSKLWVAGSSPAKHANVKLTVLQSFDCPVKTANKPWLIGYQDWQSFELCFLKLIMVTAMTSLPASLLAVLTGCVLSYIEFQFSEVFLKLNTNTEH